MENKNDIWKPVSEYTGGRVLATNGLDVLIGKINSEGDCESEEGGNALLCGITGFIKIEEMLPDLKESEDERIRKEILDYIINGSESCYDVQQYGKEKFEKWIAWLEKQGEQVLANTAKTCKDEQNSATYFYCKYGGTIPKCNDCKRNHLNSKYETKEIKTWITPTSRGTKQCSDYIQQKLSWSEEDREMRMKVLKYLSTRCNVFEYEEVECWLKSLKERVQLQIQWKPSDEQMKQLHNVFYDISAGWEDSVIESLYNDLKKLMEE